MRYSPLALQDDDFKLARGKKGVSEERSKGKGRDEARAPAQSARLSSALWLDARCTVEFEETRTYCHRRVFEKYQRQSSRLLLRATFRVMRHTRSTCTNICRTGSDWTETLDE